MIQYKSLVKKYGDKKVVDDLSFDIDDNEVFALLGSNGAGKTTIIKIILGLTEETSGDSELKKYTKIGYSPESPDFYGMLTGYKLLKYYAELQNIPIDKILEGMKKGYKQILIVKIS